MIHATAEVHESVTLGEDVIIWGGAAIMAGTQIGAHVSIGRHAEIGRECVIGEGSRIGYGVFMPARTKIGRHVFLGPRVTMCDDKHPATVKIFYTPQPPIVEDYAAIGAGAVILPGVRIGEGALVGAGAVVTRDVAPYTTVTGNPARVRPGRAVRSDAALVTCP